MSTYIYTNNCKLNSRSGCVRVEHERVNENIERRKCTSDKTSAGGDEGEEIGKDG